MPLVHALVFEDILALGLTSDSSTRVSEAEWAMDGYGHLWLWLAAFTGGFTPPNA